MTEQSYGSSRYVITDRETGEEVPFDILFEKIKPDGWQQAYARTLADYFEINGGSSTQVLVWMIKNKDPNNRIIGTVRSIAEAVGVTHPTVTEVLKKLREKNFIHRVQNGVYMLSPHILSYGGKKGIILMREWRDYDKE